MDDFSSAVKSFYKKYVDFEGTATRPEYWYAVLYSWLLIFIFYFLAFFLPYLAIPIYILMLVNVIPACAVAVRRLHDTNRSGWNLLWILTFWGGIVVMIWMTHEGRSNRWTPYNNVVNPATDMNVRPAQYNRPRRSDDDDKNDLSSGKTKFR